MRSTSIGLNSLCVGSLVDFFRFFEAKTPTVLKNNPECQGILGIQKLHFEKQPPVSTAELLREVFNYQLIGFLSFFFAFSTSPTSFHCEEITEQTWLGLGH